MKIACSLPLLMLTAMLASPPVLGQSNTVSPPQFPVDPKTGRAIGAREIAPDEVARQLGASGKVVIVDVREPDSFAKETIKGAINIPLGALEKRLDAFPKDTLLVFT